MIRYFTSDTSIRLSEGDQEEKYDIVNFTIAKSDRESYRHDSVSALANLIRVNRLP